MRSPIPFTALLFALALLTASLPAGPAPLAAAAQSGSDWVSLDTSGNPYAYASGAFSYPPAISSDGQSVAFESLAPLGAGDHNGMDDVFVRDLSQGTTDLVSASPDGGAGNNRSYAPSMSSDGAFVAFASLASDLTEGDGNNTADVFIRDRVNSTTTRVSSAGAGDADGSSFRPSISGDGNFVAFCSRAGNLVSDDTNGVADAFLWERTSGVITRIAVPGASPSASDGCLQVAADSDAGVVAFSAVTSGKAEVFVYDRASGAVTSLTEGADGPSGTGGVSISGDGSLIAFDSVADNLITGDSNRSRDVFVRDVKAGTTSRVSVRSDGSQLPGNSGTSGVSISSDGHFVVFGSTAQGVVAGDSNDSEDVFRRDLTAGLTTIASVNTLDQSANSSSYSPSVNSDGTVVAFTSLAANIVIGDGNRQPDVFVRETSFPDKAGDSDTPEDTGAPAEEETTSPVSQDGGGMSPIVLYGGIAAGVVLLLAAGSLLLGRRGRA